MFGKLIQRNGKNRFSVSGLAQNRELTACALQNLSRARLPHGAGRLSPGVFGK